MANTATFTATNPPDGYCPVGNIFQAIVSYLNGHSTVTLSLDSASSSFFYTDSTPTPVAGGIWFRKNTDAFKPYFLGIYTVYNGRWVPIPNHRIGEVMWTTEDPTGLIDDNGKGLFVPISPLSDTPNIAGGLFGYQLMNSQNGSVNLRDRFPIAGSIYQDGAWTSKILGADGVTYTQETNGGRDGITISVGNLPSVPTAEYDSTKTATDAILYAGVKYDDTATNPLNISGAAQVAIRPINPLYRSIGAFEFIGYDAASTS